MDTCLKLAVIEIQMCRVQPLDLELGPPQEPLIEEVLKMELKPQPSHLWYVYLGTN